MTYSSSEPYFKKPMAFKPLERWCIAAIYGGGLGNMIDRIRMGYVVDMIETTFMDFPVFNIADCFITCGCILIMIHLFLFNKEFWKDEKKKKDYVDINKYIEVAQSGDYDNLVEV